MRAIGIFGGTFDPIHYGHLRSAWEVYQALRLQEIRMVPCRIPPHRTHPAVTPERRAELVAAALAGQTALTLDIRELVREGPSYTVDTLVSLREELGYATPMCLIVGSDAFFALETWHQWPRLFELAHVVVMHRAGARMRVTPGSALAAAVEARQTTCSEALHLAPAGHIYVQAVTALSISASQIRALIQRGERPQYLTPQQVINLITLHGLYL
ncbi:MAG: nicotinate-nucleotide adenylyltransferase [Gammaproteobacteria bacterium]|nr:nicotinate-nucleotide adenylyltransferase [Gammaproteobacteria bacterium]